ncbi:uncharacterized protein LOC107411736 [Ziziphus jujuba]|uniref:Uncharacterized protein LOC107411736 n=1 Tax=Ziziphus jujuba TaxID=326968 RepID=A0A6P3Z9V4_ZIZJJ|nr:uncharacterized protein LOC107411736 [Ziziphus jujuba]
MNNIPLDYLRKMGTYEIKYNGVNMKVSVVDNASVVDEKMSEIRSLLQSQSHRLVGLDFNISYCQVNMVLVCVGSRCVIVQLNHMAQIPQSLISFLGNEHICFVGRNLNSYSHIWKKRLEIVDRKIGVEVGYLAAKVLKKPELLNSSLSIIAGEVGIPKEEPISGNLDPFSTVFSPEQIKEAIYDVYYSYAIGNKVLGML